MVNWQLTAKTIYCEAVDDEVTLMVFKDETARCTGCEKYTEPNSLTRQMVRQKTSTLKRTIKCQAGQCSLLTQYKTQIMAEETR